MKKWLKISLICTLSLILLLALVFGSACYMLFTPKQLTSIVNRFAKDYVNAEMKIGSIDLSYYSTYPFVKFDIENVLILNKKNPNDTLTYVPKAAATLNFNEFVFENNLILTNLEFYGGVSNVLIDETGALNWDIFPPSSDTTVDTTAFALDSLFNKIDIQRISIHSGSVNYRNAQDTQQIAVQNADIELSGSFIEQKMISDLKLNLQSVDFKDNNMRLLLPKMELNIASSTNFKDGKIRLQTEIEKIYFDYEKEVLLNKPNMKLSLDAQYDEQQHKISIHEGKFFIDQIPFSFSGNVVIADSSYYPKLAFSLEKIHYAQLKKLLPKPYANMISEYATINSGKMYCNGTVFGCYSNTSMPDVNLKFGLQHLNMRVSGVRMRIDTLNFVSDVALRMNNLDSSTLTVHELYYSGGLGKASVSAKIKGFTENPHIETEVFADLNLRRLNRMVARGSDYRTRGKIDAKLRGSFTLEDLMTFSPEHIKADGRVNIDSVFIYNRKDSLNVFIDLARFRFGSQVDEDTVRKRGKMLFRAFVRLDSMDFNYKGLYTGRIGRLSTSYRCEMPSPNAVSMQTGRISFRGLRFRMPQERMRVNVGKTSASLRITANSEKQTSPVGTMKLLIDSLFYRQKGMAVRLNSSSVNLELKPQQQLARAGTRRRGRRNRAATGDTTTPEARKQRRLDRLKEMSSDAFIEQLLGYATSTDTNVTKNFVNDFIMEGALVFDTFRLRMPTFPLPIRVLSTEVGLAPRSLSLKNAQILMGNTDMIVTGTLQNFKRALFNNGMLRGDVSVQSHKIDCNQLMQAMAYDPATDTTRRRRRRRNRADSTRTERTERTRYARARDTQIAVPAPAPEPEPLEIAEIPNSAELADDKMFEVQMETTNETALFIIPKNLNIKASAKIDSLIFGKSILTKLSGDAEIRRQSLRLNQFKFTNGAGEMNVVMAYKAKDWNEAKCWADVQIDKTDLQKLLELYPELDTMMPITQSFEGLVDCKLTVSTVLDSAMGVDLARTKANCNLRGKNLVLLDGETFTEISKMLMFKNKDRNVIDSLSVDLTVNDNKIEIFPFKLTMDRYDLAVGGTQNLDMSFNYHITVLKSPVPFKMGIDISGTMDKFKTRLVTPKFKKMDSPAISIELQNRTLNVQQELKRILDYEFEEIIGQN